MIFQLIKMLKRQGWQAQVLGWGQRRPGLRMAGGDSEASPGSDCVKTLDFVILRKTVVTHEQAYATLNVEPAHLMCKRCAHANMSVCSCTFVHTNT